MAPLGDLGFALAGYGCTTCIGNSGPLAEPIARRSSPTSSSSRPSCRATATSRAASTRSCGPRTSPPRRSWSRSRSRAASTSTSPPSRWASGATAARSCSPTSGPRRRRSGRSSRDSIDPELFRADLRLGVRGRRALDGAADPVRRPLRVGRGLDVHRPAAVLRGAERRPGAWPDIEGARVLALLGDSVTTDHISPAGSIAGLVARPASGSRRTASGRSSSTPSAPGAATTRS